MQLTNVGLGLASVIVALLAASIVFRDFFIEVTLLVVLLLVAVEVAWMRLATWKPETRYQLIREEAGASEHRVVLYPGDRSVERVLLSKRVGGKVEMKSRVNFLDIDPKTVRGAGASALEFRFRTDYAGSYQGQEVGLGVVSPLGLFSSECGIPFNVNYVVYPRVLQVAAATVRLLNTAEIGETPVPVPGVGTEYYQMRNYQHTDDVRNVNWKASAREGELVVIERMKEVGSSFLLVMDARTVGFADADRLASTFLSMANSLAAADVSFGILVHDGTSVSELSSQGDNRNSLAMALKAALRITRSGIGPELLELVPVESMNPARKGTPDDSLIAQMQELQKAELNSSLGMNDPWATASRYLREAQVRSLVYVSTLSGDIKPLIELAWQSWHYRNVDFAVANPSVNKSTELRYRKLALALRIAGARYFKGDPLDLARRTLTH
jgi:uncharacterized protein (DUF58 family)